MTPPPQRPTPQGGGEASDPRKRSAGPPGPKPPAPGDPRRTSSGSFPTLPRRAGPPDPRRTSSGSFPTMPARAGARDAAADDALATRVEPPVPDRRTQVYGGARAAAPDPLVGRTLGNFRLEEVLGRGGMAVVYRARQLDLERDVAVKVLSARLTANPRQVEQFAREAKTLARLEHPNVVTVYAFGKEEDDTCWLAVQLVRGGSLRQLLEEKKRFAPAEATSLVVQVAKGLLEAHRLGIVHRDVKPDNVLVAPGPALKLTDFGLARMAGDPGASFGAGEVVGTPHYMSPEQVDAAPDVDQRSDIYSLGATFYHLLTGAPPYTGRNTLELLLKHVNEPLVAPHERAKDVPAALSQVVCRMMAKDRAERYASLDEVLRDLEAGTATAASSAAHAADAATPTLLMADAMPALRLEPLRVERPRSLTYAAVALVATIGIATGVSLGPLRAVLADQRHDGASEDPAAEAAREALARLRPTLATLSPADRAEALRGFVAERAGTAAAASAQEELASLEREQAQARAAAAAAALDEVQRQVDAGALGPALDALAAVAPELLQAAEERAAAVRARVVADLDARGVRWIPGGATRVGEGARARDVVVAGVYVDAREVTASQYARFVAATGAAPPAAWGGAAPSAAQAPLPVTGVSLRQAQAYATWRGGRVPAAAEWERAARGAEGRTFPWGDDADPQACNWRGAGRGQPVAPATYPRDTSPFGCLDMAGNVAELSLPDGAPAGAAVAWARGGSYLTGALGCVRGAYHQELGVDEGHPAIGLRCVYDAPPPPAESAGGGR